MPQKKTPTALRLLRGNPGKRPINRNEPKPEGTATMPSYLSRGAVKIWGELEPGLTATGVLTSADSRALALLCELLAEHERDALAMPASRLAQLRPMLAEFGLTPSSRAKIVVPAKNDDEFERMFLGSA